MRPRLQAHACMLIASAHHTCQCDRNPPATKKVFVQPASAPNRQAASAPAIAATGVSNSPASDNARPNRTPVKASALTSSEPGSVWQRAIVLVSIEFDPLA